MLDLNDFVKISRSFYVRPDVAQIASDLLGKYLFTDICGTLTAGKIVETEAYDGRKDKACHAYGKKTPRTKIMYEMGGHAYIYLCYGIHHLFNVVTNKSGLADAVLIRAIEPCIGYEKMMDRRGTQFKKRIASGPGSLSAALGINRSMSGLDLTGDQIWICEYGERNFEIETDRRVGVDYAGEDALLPWRFWIKDNKWISRQKQPEQVL